MSTAFKSNEWVKFNPLTATYDTPDGTKVPEELADNAQSIADLLHTADVRAQQRAAIKGQDETL